MRADAGHWIPIASAELGQDQHDQKFSAAKIQQGRVELGERGDGGRQHQPGEHPEEGLGEEGALDLRAGLGRERVRANRPVGWLAEAAPP